MNKLESAYRDSLEMMARAGEIQSYMFEPVKLRLADRTTYTPDFMVIAANDIVELHEVKGFWEDDARVKIKVAAEMFPMFLFKAFTRKKGMWIEETF
jgi:hypothetical protein